MKTPQQSIIYAGYSDCPEKEQLYLNPAWKCIPNTVEDRQQALADGYTAFTSMSFSFEPRKGEPEPVRYGDLIIDFDSKESPSEAYEACQQCVVRLELVYGVDIRCLKAWLSGSKGAHLLIPAEVFGGENGDTELPNIHRAMVRELDRELRYSYAGYIDTQMYCMGRGKLLREANIRRPNGRYKVPLTMEELTRCTYAYVEPLTAFPRHLDDTPEQLNPARSEKMCEFFTRHQNLVHLIDVNRHPISGLEAIMECRFLQHCKEHAATLKEPVWWAMINILVWAGQPGKQLIHELSAPYPRYTKQETDRKIQEALKSDRSCVSCRYLRSLYDCGCSCGVKSPLSLLQKASTANQLAASRYRVDDEGVFYMPDSGKEIFICSRLDVLSKIRSPEGDGWGRVVKIYTPDHKEKVIYIPMRDCSTAGENLRSRLADNGLEISCNPKAQVHLVEYIRTAVSNDNLATLVLHTGWHDEMYVLPDCCFGMQPQFGYFFEGGSDSLHRVSGTLDEWKQHVGSLCKGNDLLVFVTSYALTGVLLKPLGLEGGGFNLYGNSSLGKTTSAIACGSVCGGGGRNGYCQSCRTTHNALESMAAMHTDTLLILDELSQVSSEALSQAIYMLANGEGKSRLRSDISRRPSFKWLLNFLMTGEVTINDKIAEDGRKTAFAGQLIRVVDLPIDAGVSAPTFPVLHGLNSGSELSDRLKSNAKQYYGTPLRAFLEILCTPTEKETCFRIVKDTITSFMQSHCPEDSSGQVKRVAQRFALVAGAGELAIASSIFPYEQGEAAKAAEKWFMVWLQQRVSKDNLELQMAMECVKEEITIRDADYIDCDLDSKVQILPRRNAGCKWTEGYPKKKIYLINSPTMRTLLRNVTRTAFIEWADAKGYLAHTDRGKPLESKSVNGRNVHGLAFVPSSWEGKIADTPRRQQVNEDDWLPSQQVLFSGKDDLSNPDLF